MYLREMGSVELLSREGEIAIAKRIEAGRELMIGALCEGPLTFEALTVWRDELNEGKALLRDIIDLEAMYGGVPGQPGAPVALGPDGQPIPGAMPPGMPGAAGMRRAAPGGVVMAAAPLQSPARQWPHGGRGRDGAAAVPKPAPPRQGRRRRRGRRGRSQCRGRAPPGEDDFDDEAISRFPPWKRR